MIPTTPTERKNFARDNAAIERLFHALDEALDTFADLGEAHQPEWRKATPAQRFRWMQEQAMVAVALFFNEAEGLLSDNRLTEEERSAWVATVRETAKRG